MDMGVIPLVGINTKKQLLKTHELLQQHQFACGRGIANQSKSIEGCTNCKII